MFPLRQDLRTLGSAPVSVARWAPVRWFGWLQRWQRAARARQAAARAEAAQVREIAAFEACAMEGATTEFDVVILGGQRYGAVYVDGKLSCLLPHVERL